MGEGLRAGWERNRIVLEEGDIDSGEAGNDNIHATATA